MKYSTVFGIDSHARTTTICALGTDSGETETRTFRNDYEEMSKWMARFPSPAIGVYEAGCTGYVPARKLTRGDVLVVPVAPSKMPTSDNSRKQKNDKRDAMRLARLEVAGEPGHVWVPDEGVEGLRDAGHAIEDLRREPASARLRVSSLLGRHGFVWDERTKTGKLKKTWGTEYRAWLSRVRLPDESSQLAPGCAIRMADSVSEQLDSLVKRSRELAEASRFEPYLRAMCCLKCVNFTTALTFVATVGDFSRIPSGRKLNSYLGFAPSESPGGETQSLGAISRSGSGMTRKVLTECAWAVGRCNPSKMGECPEDVDPRVWEMCVSLSQRLVWHRRRLDASMRARKRAANGDKRGYCRANSASAAEIGRFLLFIGKKVDEVLAEGSEDAA